MDIWSSAIFLLAAVAIARVSLPPEVPTSRHLSYSERRLPIPMPNLQTFPPLDLPLLPAASSEGEYQCKVPSQDALSKTHQALAYSLLKARPMTIRRISDVPAPISYSFALHRWLGIMFKIVTFSWERDTHSRSNRDAGISST